MSTLSTFLASRTALACALTLLAASPASSAQSTYVEDFEAFALGNLSSQGGWTEGGQGSAEIFSSGLLGLGGKTLRYSPPSQPGTGGSAEVLRSPLALGGQDGKLFFDCIISGTDREYSLSLLDVSTSGSGVPNWFLLVKFQPDGLITVLQNVGSTLSAFSLASDTWSPNVPMRIGLEFYSSASKVRVWKDGTAIFDGFPFAPAANYPDSMDAFVVFDGTAGLGTGNSATIVLDNFSSQSCPTPTSYCSALPNSSGQAAQMFVNGSLSLTDNDMGYSVFSAAPSSFGLLFYGSQQIQTPIGEGLRCVGGGSLGVFRVGPVQTLSPSNLPFSSGGNAFVDLDLTHPTFTIGSGTLTPGSTWNFQFVFRDQTAQGASTLNTTNAVQVTFCP